MKSIEWIVISLVVLLFSCRLQAKELIFSTMCDASAGIALDDQHFIAVNDEDNLLRIFRLDQREPVFVHDLSAFLAVEYDDKSPEVDLEGAARIGDVVYLISSHGRDKEGRLRENRHRFFALRIERREKEFTIHLVGKPYSRLLDDLVADPLLRSVGLDESYLPQKKRDKELRPKRRGVNIEGLAASADGKSLLIGFRNPRPKGRALVVTLLNPSDVIKNSAKAQFGKPLLLELGGLGIRSMEYVADTGCWLIIAGKADGSVGSAIFIWDGISTTAYRLEIALPADLTPESLFFYPNGLIHLLSDDGEKPIRNSIGELCQCKEADEVERKMFRSILINLPAACTEGKTN